MAKVICMASPKGGSGKTVLTTTFATLLVSMGKRALIVDTDAATNGLTLLHLREVMRYRELLSKEADAPQGIYETRGDVKRVGLIELPSGVHLIPATYRFQNTEDVGLSEYESALRAMLRHYDERYDYIFLDAQAGSDAFAHIAMLPTISDEVVVVSEYDPLSAAGVERLKALFADALQYTRTWILLNKMLPEFVQSFSEFMEIARYLSPVPWDADVVRAYARRRLAIDVEVGNSFTLAVIQTLRSLLGEDIHDSIDDWVLSRAAVLRQPIEQQYDDAQQELKALVDARVAAGRASRLRRAVRSGTTLFVVALSIIVSERTLKHLLPEWVSLSTLVALFGMATVMLTEVIYRDRGTNIEFAQKQEELLLQRIHKLDVLRHGNLDLLLRRDELLRK
jgi:MinD-like ATPase involved in chromosome partitioning or flagellar assembly